MARQSLVRPSTGRVEAVTAVKRPCGCKDGFYPVHDGLCEDKARIRVLEAALRAVLNASGSPSEEGEEMWNALKQVREALKEGSKP
jgi:S-ribosylhomocysteine lyase LuxS involved in autoinducer biosynthesis